MADSTVASNASLSINAKPTNVKLVLLGMAWHWMIS